MDLRDGPAGVLLVHAHGRDGAQLRRLVAGVRELEAQRHREAARVGRSDQLLGIRAGAAVLGDEARVDAVWLVLQRARQRGDRSVALRSAPVPDGGARSLQHARCIAQRATVALDSATRTRFFFVAGPNRFSSNAITSLHTSWILPAPSVITRSPERACSSSQCARSSRRDTYVMSRCPASRASLTSASLVMPSIGFSPAAKMSHTTTLSASWKARANSGS